MSRRLAHAAAGLLGGAAAWPAHAHLVETGFGTFYDGVAHLAVTASDLLVVLALALLAGQRGPQAARWSLFVLPAAWLIAGIAGARGAVEPGAVFPVLTTLSFGAAGVLVAFSARLPPAAVAVYAAMAGGLHGFLNGAALTSGAGTLALAGAAAAAFCLLALVSAQVATLRADWTRIAVRVAGSWLGAAALLMIGWQVRLSG